MIAAWCFQCQLDYAPDVAECVECGVPTVDHPPMPVDPSDTAERLAYELHAWNGAARAKVENLLYRASLGHIWQGPTLLVAAADETAVDVIIETVDDSMTTSAEDSGGAEGGRIGFDLGARNQDLHVLVGARLSAENVEYDLTESGYLLIDPAHEDQVGDWIEEIQVQLREKSTFGPGVDGVDAHQVVEAMFLAADSLRRNTRDGRAGHQLLETESLARDLKLPFGYEATMWRGVLDQAAVLVALIEDSAEDDLIEAESATLREMLHAYV